MKGSLACAVLLAVMALGSCDTDVVYCYWGAWSQWHQGVGKYTTSDINPNLCTHIAYGFIGLDTAGNIDTLGATDNFPAFQNLKQINPNVKLLISMGGWNEGSTGFSTVTNDDNLRATLVQNIYNFVTSNNLDGIDIDWEYPDQRGGVASDYQSYIWFLRDLKAKLGPAGLLVTAAVGAYIQSDGATYDVPNMNKYLDFFNVMTYDYHGNWDPVTGLNSPLYPAPIDTNKDLNMAASINGWIQAGASPSKLLPGLAFYGRSFTLSNPSDNGVGAPKSGPGNAGPFTQTAGMLSYLEICMDIKQGGWTTVFDQTAEVPYSYSGNQWVGYDNTKSLGIKVDWARSLNLGGVMIWSIDQDDAHNVCGGGNSPLLSAVYSTMYGKAAPPPPPPPAAPATPSWSTPSAPSAPAAPAAPAGPSPVGAKCTQAGFLRDSGNCAVFYNCVSNGSGGYTQYPFNCPAGLWFDVNTDSCNYENQVTGC